MKTLVRSLIIVATAAAVSPSALAAVTPPNIPDGGATAALLGLGIAGLVGAKRFFGKK